MIFEKTRELAQLIHETEEAGRLQVAKAAFEIDTKANHTMNEYKEYQQNLQLKMEAGIMSKEEFHESTKKLRVMGNELKENDVIRELLEAENSFNHLVNQVLDILKYSITGEESAGKGCGGSCGGCH